MLDAELTIVGPDGPIRGGAEQRGSGAIAVLAVRHALTAPRDAATGLAVGRRQHAPVVVVKELDRSTPRLLAAWARNEIMTTWQLAVFGADPFGRRAKRYTIELRRAGVAEIAMSGSDAEPSALPRESVAFAYERITWTWHDGNVTATDAWAAAAG